MYPDEPFRRNYSRLVSDSLSNYHYYIYIYDVWQLNNKSNVIQLKKKKIYSEIGIIILN